jgi:hypothetical protein
LVSKLQAEEDHDHDRNGRVTTGDAAILRFLAAAEIIESELWLQYEELGGVQDSEVSQLARKLIPGYPAKHRGKPRVHAGPDTARPRHVPIHS